MNPEQHRISWFVYAHNADGTTTRIPRRATMRGQWGYDVECTCGWATHRGRDQELHHERGLVPQELRRLSCASAEACGTLRSPGQQGPRARSQQ